MKEETQIFEDDIWGQSHRVYITGNTVEFNLTDWSGRQSVANARTGIAQLRALLDKVEAALPPVAVASPCPSCDYPLIRPDICDNCLWTDGPELDPCADHLIPRERKTYPVALPHGFVTDDQQRVNQFAQLETSLKPSGLQPCPECGETMNWLDVCDYCSHDTGDDDGLVVA